jgi:hypothetical protein
MVHAPSAAKKASVSSAFMLPLSQCASAQFELFR